MAVPKPSTPVCGSRTGRPIMALLDLLGRRWTMRIIWELRDEALTFRELRARCDDVSPSSLNQRLHELRETQLVETGEEGGYALTESGRSLLRAMMPLLAWSEEWKDALAACGDGG